VHRPWLREVFEALPAAVQLAAGGTAVPFYTVFGCH
jgi:hypothetical protein